MSSTDALQPDTMLGKFRILRQLGKGGMGEVYLAEDTLLKRKVALKTMRPALAELPKARKRFLREARSAAAVEHHRIVHINEIGEIGDVVFISMELLPGRSLEDLLENAPVPSLRFTLEVIKQICEALDAAHTAEPSLIHRDVKPPNTWLKSNPANQDLIDVKLLDFGLARAAEGDSISQQAGGVMGTPYYMAPEQWRGRDVDARSDLFSVGVMFFEMTTGQKPFVGNPMQISVQAMTIPHPEIRELAPTLPEAVCRLIDQLLAKEKNGRPGTAREVVLRIEGLQRDLPAEATPIAGTASNSSARPETETPTRSGSPSPTPFAEILPERRLLPRVTMLGLALLVGVGVFVLLKYDPKPEPVVVTKQDEQLLAKLKEIEQKYEALQAGQGKKPVTPEEVLKPPLEIISASPEALTSLEITRAREAPYSLQLDGRAWKLTAPIQAPADPNLIRPLATSLSNLRVVPYETQGTLDLAEYGLKTPALKIRFTLVDPRPEAGTRGSKERTLLIGNPVSPDKASRFAKLENESSIFVVSENLFRVADLPMLDLIDRKLLRVFTAVAIRVELSTPEGNLKLVRETNPWKVEGASFPIDMPTLDQFLRRFEELNAETFAAFGSQIDFAKFGLDAASKPILVSVALEKSVHKIEIGIPVDEKQPTGARYARVDGDSAVVILSGSVATDLIRSRLDFVERSLLRFDPIELTGITRAMDGQKILELRQGVTGGWEITRPLGRPADTEMLDDLALRCAKLRAEKIVSLDGKDLAKFGLDRPQATVTFELIDQRTGKEVKRILKIGNVVNEPSLKDDRYVQVEGSQLVGILGVSVARRLLGDPIRFLNHRLGWFVVADRIEVTRGERKLTFRKEATWKLTSPLEADSEDEALRDVHDALARLRADEIVIEKPASLKEYGLDQPEVIWKLFDGEKEVLSLLIGKREKDDFRRYAKLEKGDLVVLLDRGLSSRLESEYRSRALGERIDVTQITELTLDGPDGKLTLTKVGANWVTPQKGDEQWNLTAIHEMLESMANGKIPEYVKDQDANLADFGLASPRTVTVRTGMGQSRTLLLGKMDPSKRLYAKFGDPTRAGVFVLDERDSARLNRRKDDLLQTGRAPQPVPNEKR